jgi:uroporphyrinogen decarboxylase
VDIHAPNIERLLRAFAIAIPDRVPILEILVNTPTLEHVMGRQLAGSLRGTIAAVDPAAYEETADACHAPSRLYAQQDPALSTLNISPGDYVEFCQRASIDAMVVQIQWTGLPDFTASMGLVADWADLEKMSPPPDMDFMRAHVQGYIDAAQGTGIGVAIFGASCLARAIDAVGFENLCLKLYDDPAFVAHVMDTFTDYAVAVAETTSQMDIAFYMYADDVADNRGLILPPRVMEELWLPRVERILAPYRAAGLPLAYHCDGNLTEVIPLALRLGFNAIQPLQANCNDIYAIKRQYGDRLCLIGNVEVSDVLSLGSREEVVADTIEHLERLAPGGGYVLGSSHSITAAVKPENFETMIETGLAYGIYEGNQLRRNV